MGSNWWLRTGQVLITAWLIASAVFLISRGSAGSRPQLQPDDATAKFGQPTAEREYRNRLGLNTPVFYCRVLPWRWHGTPNQYHTWLTQTAKGQLGVSFRDGVPVADHLRTALAVTLPMTVSALLLAAVLALAGALLAVRYPGWDRIITFLGFLLDSLSLLVVSLLLLLLLANPDAWPLFPAYGLGSLESASNTWAGLLDRIAHLVLPVSALTLACLPAMLLPTLAALRQQGQQPYVTTARAKGLTPGPVWRRHILPNVLPIFITRLSDQLPSVLAGAVVVEVVFALPGTGRLLAEAAAARDLPVLVGGVLLIAAARLLAWWLADLATSQVDPRHHLS